MRLLLQDVTEKRRGHRNVTDEEVMYAFRQMDQDCNDEVSQYEFIEYFKTHSLSFNIISYGSADEEFDPFAGKAKRARGISRGAALPEAPRGGI